MSEQDHILDILSIIKKNYHLNEHKASLFLSGETDTETVISDSRGSMKVLGEAFFNQMRVRPEFNKLMKALMGAYLSQNPEEKEEFILGLELMKNTPNMN